MSKTVQPIEKLFPETSGYTDEDFKRVGTDKPVLMIAMTARTGSSHLCSGLASVLPIGKPTELLNARDTIVWEKEKHKFNTFEELLQAYFNASREIVVFKSNWIDFKWFSSKVFLMFPNLNIIYLNRLDVEAQAVSLFKAVVSGMWHDSPSIAKGKSITKEDLVKRYDLVKICRVIQDLEEEKKAWEQFFFDNEVQPARVYYEHFKNDLKGAIRQIIKHIGYSDFDISGIKSEFKPLTDEVNDEWLHKTRMYRNGNFFSRYISGELTESSR